MTNDALKSKQYLKRTMKFSSNSIDILQNDLFKINTFCQRNLFYISLPINIDRHRQTEGLLKVQEAFTIPSS